MRAVRITGDHVVDVIDAPLPAVAAADVLVKPACCGICGTDLHILRHGFVGTRYPVTPGHEFAGHVVAAGRDVMGLKEGDFVAVDPNVVCGGCRWCRAGRPNLCIHLSPIGVGRPGAMAEYVAVPARNAFLVRESIGHGVAALIEPLACALHAVESARGTESRKVLVLGAGTMGLLIAITCRAFGAGSITVSDPARAKREIARRIGFEDTCEPAEPGGELFDVVFEAAGAPAALEQAVTLVDKTGTLVQVGVHDAEATVAFNPFRLYERELHFVGSNSCADRFEPAVELMSDIRDTAAVLIGESFPVWEFESAVRSMESGRSIKTQLRFS